MKKKLYASILALLVVPAVCGAATYYADNTCADCADYNAVARECGTGTATNYDTITEIPAAVVLTSADTIFVRAGTYDGEQVVIGSVDSGVTIEAYPGESVMVNGNAGNYVFDIDSANGDIGWLTIMGGSGAASDIRFSTGTGDISSASVSHCNLSGGNRGVQLYAYNGHTIHDVDLTANVIGTTGLVASSYGIDLVAGDNSDADAGTIYSVDIDGNNLDTCAGRGVVVRPGDGASQYTADGFTIYGIDVSNNTFTDNPNDSIQFFGVTDNGGANRSNINGNTITGAGTGETVAANAIRLGSVKGVDIYDNDVSNSYSSTTGDANAVIFDHWQIGLTTLTGTWRFTNGSATITEVGEGEGSATTELNHNTKIKVSDGTVWYTVSGVTDNNTVVLTEVFAETTVDDAPLKVEWCEDVDVYKNYFHDLTDGYGCGVTFYRSKNSTMHHNYVNNACALVQVNSAANEGGKIINNTGDTFTKHGILLNNYSPEIVIKNNIFKTVNYSGVYKVALATAPAESTNLYYNVDDSDCYGFTCTDPVTVDPYLDTQGRPALNSPAINSGVGVGLPFWGSAPERGAYEVGGYPMKINNLPYTMPIWRMGVQ